MKKMYRVIVGIVIAVFMNIAIFTVSSIAETIKWRLVSCWPPKAPSFVSTELFAKSVYELSGGRLKITVYPAGELVPALAVFDTVSKGAAEMGGDWPGYWGNKNSAFDLLGSYPMGLGQHDMVNWYLKFGGREIYNDLYGKYNMVFVIHGCNPVACGIRSIKPIKSLADFKGKKIRISGRPQGYILQKAGAVQIMIAPGEISLALQTGTVDAASFNTPAMDWSVGMAMAKYNIAPAWESPSAVGGIIINKDAWNTLPPDLKRIIEVASLESMLIHNANEDMIYGPFLEKFKNSGTIVTKFSAKDLKQIEEWMWEYVVEEAKKNPDYNKVATSMFQYLKDFRATRDYQQPFSHGRNLMTLPKLPDLK